MGYPTKVQQITRKDCNQYYINFPMALARAVGIEKGEIVEWEIKDRDTLVIKRTKAVGR